MVLDFDHSLNRSTSNSGNNTTNTTNTNLALGVDDVGNSDSHDATATALGSFNTDDSTDNSSHGSGNTWTNNLAYDSNNTTDVNLTDDHSVNVGDRTYNLGGGSGGGGGSGSNTVVDQSVNANVHSFGPSFIVSDGSSVVASGAGSIAAGDDVNISEHLDDSTHITAAFGGDVNLDNTSTVTTNWNSGNVLNDSSTHMDDSTHVGVSDSFNSADFSTTTDDSFNSEVHNVDTSHWDVDANVIWGSAGAGIIDAGS